MKLKPIHIFFLASCVVTSSMACPDHDHGTSGTASQSSSGSSAAASTCWIRQAQKGKNTAAYVCTCVADVEDLDELLSVQSDVADNIELHDHINDNGVMRMRPVSSILIEKDKTIMKPGGKHIMLFGLKRDLAKGEKVTLNLTFKNAGTKEIEFVVDQPGV